jgi:hypothetical protein
VGYYSAPSGFSKIQPGKNLDKAMFSKNGTNAFEASLWYEGFWRTQDYSGREFPKVTTTLTPVFPVNRNGTQVIADLLPVEVNCPELYMFGGHKNDVVELCKVSGIACEWKLKNASQVIGTFDHPTDSACSFTATTAGKNTIQLVVGGKVVWEKPTEILDLKSRATWGAKPVDMAHMDGTMPSIAGATFHHSANTNDGIAEIQRIQNEHQANEIYYFTHENWGDIAYHFVMTKDGTVYVGRELEAAPGSAGGRTRSAACRDRGARRAASGRDVAARGA